MQHAFAIIYSEFNVKITQSLFDGAHARLIARGTSSSQIDCVKVPGAIEIPLIAKLFAQKKKHSAIICLGAVIRGETNHYDYVCQQVSQGLQEVMLEFELPIIFGILTTENAAQAYARTGGAKGHKGIEAADAAIYMAELMEKMKSKN